MEVTMKIQIPNGGFCDDCPCFLTQLDSYAYEESHNWCFYLKKDLNKEVPFDGRKTKKPKRCPAYKEAHSEP